MLPGIPIFSASKELAPGTESAPTHITARPARVAKLAPAGSGDLDGDGDLVVITTAGGLPQNDGTGHFTP